MRVRAISSTRWVPRARRLLAGTGAAGLLLGAAACGAGESTATWSGWRDIGVALIAADSADPFFVAMKEGAEDDAARIGVKLTVAPGMVRTDPAGQVRAVEAAIARGDKGILVIPGSAEVNASLKKARDAGLYVIALDTAPDPADSVDVTFATDDRTAGRLVGRWAAERLGGKPAHVAIFEPVDQDATGTDDRDLGFLEGLGILGAAAAGGPAPTGSYTGGAGGEYAIRCDVEISTAAPVPATSPSASPSAGPTASAGPTSSPAPSSGATPDPATQDPAAAIRACLAASPDVSVVYATDHATATAASAALTEAGMAGVLVVSVDGSCPAVETVEEGVVGATAQPDPRTMAALGMEAIAKVARGGEKPTTSEGLDIVDTGTALVTATPVEGLESISTTSAAKTCWG